MKIQDELKALLTREKPPTVAECNAMLPRVSLALAEARERLAPVHPGGGHDFPNKGDEFKAALLSGSPEKVTEVRSKYERLQSEYDILQHFNKELGEQRIKARVREAVEGLPKLQADLVAKLDAVDAARRALGDAVAALDAAYTAVAQARGDCNMGGMGGGAEPATRETIQRVAELHRYLGRRSGTEPQWIANDLGHDHLSERDAA